MLPFISPFTTAQSTLTPQYRPYSQAGNEVYSFPRYVPLYPQPPILLIQQQPYYDPNFVASAIHDVKFLPPGYPIPVVIPMPCYRNTQVGKLPIVPSTILNTPSNLNEAQKSAETENSFDIFDLEIPKNSQVFVGTKFTEQNIELTGLFNNCDLTELLFGVKTFPNKAQCVGTFDSKRGCLTSGVIFFANGNIQIGEFDSLKKGLIKSFKKLGEVNQPFKNSQGQPYIILQEGTCNSESVEEEPTSSMYEKKLLENGTLLVGKFDPITHFLLEGCIKHASGTFSFGIFDQKTRHLVKGFKISLPKNERTNGNSKSHSTRILIGDFDADESHLIEGHKLTENGFAQCGKFNHDGRLNEGEMYSLRTRIMIRKK